MHRLARFLLAALLAFVVPLQGFAAATSGMCMVLGHHDAAPAHAHDSGAPGGHHGHDHGQPADSSAHCPPCVACCASAVIAASVILVHADQGPDVLNAAGPPLPAGIHRTVADRPPLAL